MKNLNIILTLIVTLTVVITSVAQVQLNDVVLQNNGAIISIVNANTISSSSSIHNNGKIYFGGNFNQTTTNDTLSNQNLTDTIFAANNFNISNGVYDGENQYTHAYKGALVMNGASNQALNSKTIGSDNIYNLVVNNTSALIGVNINGNVIVSNDIKFIDGRFRVNNSDTLALTSDGTVSGSPRMASHVNGKFYREGSLTSLIPYDLFYPIGIGTKYRPATLKNHPAKVGAEIPPIIGIETFSGTAAGATSGMGVEALVNSGSSMYWHGDIRSGDYKGAQLQLSYGLADGISVADQPTLIVTQSGAVGGKYVSLDVSNVTANTVTSNFKAGGPFYMIGKSQNVRVDLTAYLEGNYVSPFTMHDSLRTNVKANYLENRYVFNADSINFYGIEMLKNYTPPVGAVDVIMVTIRDVAALSVDIDTAFVWLMTDGSVRSFIDGEVPYATFKDLSLNLANNHSIVVWHRNHVPLMYKMTGETLTRNTVSPTYYNLSDPTSIYGVGYKDLTGVSALYAGNADQDNIWYSVYETDAMDYDKVRLDANGGMPVYYIDTDVNMDAKVNNDDWNITKWANDQLYYSTFPF